MKKTALNTSLLRSRLKLKNFQAESILKAHHPQAVSRLEEKGIRPGSLRQHATRLLTAGAAASTLILTPSQTTPIIAALPDSSHTTPQTPQDSQTRIKTQLKNLLPTRVSPLSPVQENQISTILHDILGIHATATLEGNRLNQSYGLIGAEQHLPRYPGDTVHAHSSHIESGITPGRGAWGYFAQSSQELTPDLVEKEKYYVAVQTLYLPDWSTRLSYLRDWYKFRKVLVVNPNNGKAVVAVIADSGPASWTGKHFGGSPEIMDYLDLNVGKQKGPVILFFVDDPTDGIPLGPLEYNLERPPLLLPS